MKDGRSGAARSSQKRCGIYTRVALAPFAGPGSRTSRVQREVCEHYIRTQRDWQILEERYDDLGASGATLRRPALQRLLCDIAALRVDVVVVSASDRLTRGYLDFALLMRRMRGVGTQFASVSEGFWTGEPTGQRMLYLLLAFLDLENAVPAAPDEAFAPVPGDERAGEP